MDKEYYAKYMKTYYQENKETMLLAASRNAILRKFRNFAEDTDDIELSENLLNDMKKALDRIKSDRAESECKEGVESPHLNIQSLRMDS